MTPTTVTRACPIGTSSGRKGRSSGAASIVAKGVRRLPHPTIAPQAIVAGKALGHPERRPGAARSSIVVASHTTGSTSLSSIAKWVIRSGVRLGHQQRRPGVALTGNWVVLQRRITIAMLDSPTGVLAGRMTRSRGVASMLKRAAPRCHTTVMQSMRNGRRAGPRPRRPGVASTSSVAVAVEARATTAKQACPIGGLDGLPTRSPGAVLTRALAASLISTTWCTCTCPRTRSMQDIHCPGGRGTTTPLSTPFTR